MAFGARLRAARGLAARRVRAFLDLDDPAAQIAFWRGHLDTWRFRAALRRAALGRRPARRLRGPLPRLPARRLRRGDARGAWSAVSRATPTATNPYARALLLGERPDCAAAPEATGIRLVHADAAASSRAARRQLRRLHALEHPRRRHATPTGGACCGGEARRRAGRGRGPAQLRRAARASPTNRAADDRSMLWGIVDVRPAAAF